MAKFYKVSKAFQATVSKEDKSPVIDQYGNVKYMFQVENQGKDGWMSILRKEGSTLAPGDYVYGIVDEWDNGKAKFVKQQVPEGVDYPADAPKRTPAAAPAPTTEEEGSIHEKLDYIIGILEEMTIPENIKEVLPGAKPVSLAELDI